MTDTRWRVRAGTEENRSIDRCRTARGRATGRGPITRMGGLRLAAGVQQSMSRRKLNREAIWGLLFILPAVVFFAVFYFYPIVWAGWISLHDYNMLTDPKWVGLDNYERLFRGHPAQGIDQGDLLLHLWHGRSRSGSSPWGWR